jgi:hypothetical protein
MPKYSAECNVIANIKQKRDKLYEELRRLKKIGEARSRRAESLLVEIAQLVALIWRCQAGMPTRNSRDHLWCLSLLGDIILSVTAQSRKNHL